MDTDSGDIRSGHVLRSLSCPLEPQYIGLVQMLVEESGRARLRRFLADSNGELALSGGVIGGLESLLDAPLGLAWWDPALQGLEPRDREEGPQPATRAAVEILVHAMGLGLEIGPWQVDLERPLVAIMGNAALRLDGRVGHDAVMIARDRHDRLPQFAIGERRVLLLDRSVMPHGGPEDAAAAALPSVDDGAIACFTAAAKVMSSVAPEYTFWVGRMLRKVLVYEYVENNLRSGSSSNWPGLIYGAAAPNPFLLAELLVHEGTHQYMHLAKVVGPIWDRSDATLYWSPAKRMMRSIDKIILAYHAFANVALFYRLCLELPNSGGYHCAASLVATESMLDEMESALTESTAITDVGRALIEPLIERRMSASTLA